MIPKRHLLVLGTFLLSVLLYVDRICISVAETPVREDLGLSKREFGWVLSAFALGYALCQTPGGRLADRFGPRKLLAAVVAFWSACTGLTAAAFSWASMLLVRFVFGCGEAGAFPGMARAAFSWIPMRERGFVQGINFSGSRIGAALALPVVAWMVEGIGWRVSFVTLMLVGFAWAGFWWRWFRDDPTEHPRIGRRELDVILATRQRPDPGGSERPRASVLGLARSRNVRLLSAQYFASNFTFFFCLTWLFPHLKEKYALEGAETGLYASAPFLCGALGNWVAGALVDHLYRRGRWTASRRLPAMIGFALAATGLVASMGRETPLGSVVWFSLAIFGADMTLPPSWSTSIDIGRRDAGVVSGTMNMAGNLGSFLTALAFPYLAEWTGSNEPFFLVAAALNALALFVWLRIQPERRLEEF